MRTEAVARWPAKANAFDVPPRVSFEALNGPTAGRHLFAIGAGRLAGGLHVFRHPTTDAARKTTMASQHFMTFDRTLRRMHIINLVEQLATENGQNFRASVVSHPRTGKPLPLASTSRADARHQVRVDM